MTLQGKQASYFLTVEQKMNASLGLPDCVELRITGSLDSIIGNSSILPEISVLLWSEK
jgi:hypothetical protein